MTTFQSIGRLETCNDLMKRSGSSFTQNYRKRIKGRRKRKLLKAGATREEKGKSKIDECKDKENFDKGKNKEEDKDEFQEKRRRNTFKKGRQF